MYHYFAMHGLTDLVWWVSVLFAPLGGIVGAVLESRVRPAEDGSRTTAALVAFYLPFVLTCALAAGIMVEADLAWTKTVENEIASSYSVHIDQYGDFKSTRLNIWEIDGTARICTLDTSHMRDVRLVCPGTELARR